MIQENEHIIFVNQAKTAVLSKFNINKFKRLKLLKQAYKKKRLL